MALALSPVPPSESNPNEVLADEDRFLRQPENNTGLYGRHQLLRHRAGTSTYRLNALLHGCVPPQGPSARCNLLSQANCCHATDYRTRNRLNRKTARSVKEQCSTVSTANYSWRDRADSVLARVEFDGLKHSCHQVAAVGDYCQKQRVHTDQSPELPVRHIRVPVVWRALNLGRGGAR